MITSKIEGDRIEVEDLSDDKLSRRIWRFTLGGRHYSIVTSAATLLLETYDEETRPSTRHKWRGSPSMYLGEERYYRGRRAHKLTPKLIAGGLLAISGVAITQIRPGARPL